MKAATQNIIGERAPIFWTACAAIAVGVLLHLPMLEMAHRMGNELHGMPMDTTMWVGMALILVGVPAAVYGALPGRRAPGLLLLAVARFIPESPRFLAERGATAELADMQRKFGLSPRPRERVPPPDAQAAAKQHGRLTAALVMTALSWSFINFGLLLWLPTDLEAPGYSSALGSGIIASSALIAFPTIFLAAWLYSRVSSKWTLVGTIVLTVAGLVGALLPAHLLSWPPLLIAMIAILIIGTNGMIAALLPYCAENYPLGIRGRATGLVAGSSKFGGVAVQGFAIAGFIPTLTGAAAALLGPAILSAALIGWAGRETRGRSLRELEAT